MALEQRRIRRRARVELSAERAHAGVENPFGGDEATRAECIPMRRNTPESVPRAANDNASTSDHLISQKERGEVAHYANDNNPRTALEKFQRPSPVATIIVSAATIFEPIGKALAAAGKMTHELYKKTEPLGKAFSHFWETKIEKGVLRWVYDFWNIVGAGKKAPHAANNNHTDHDHGHH